MGVTHEEAIRIIEKEIHIDVRCCTHEDACRFEDALRMAIAALREQEANQMALKAACSTLEQYINAEKEGRMIVLPCKEGDTVYEVHNNTDACTTCQHFSSWFGTDALCDSPEIDVEHSDYPNVANRPVCEKQFMEVVEYQPKIDSIFYGRNNFGKTMFLTREEAEDALRRLEEA